MTAFALLQSLLSPELLNATIACFVNIIDTQKNGHVSFEFVAPLEYFNIRIANSILVSTRCNVYTIVKAICSNTLLRGCTCKTANIFMDLFMSVHGSSPWNPISSQCGPVVVKGGQVLVSKK